MDEFGRKSAEWLPYWNNSEYVKVGQERAYVSLYRHPKNGVLAVISNLGKDKMKIKVELVLNKLGLSDNATAIDSITKEKISYKNGIIDVTLDPIDWKLVWIK